MTRMTKNCEELMKKLAAKDFGNDDIAVAVVIEALRQTVADIKWGRGGYSRKSSLQKKLALEDARSEAIHTVGGLLGYGDPPAPAAAADDRGIGGGIRSRRRIAA